MTDLIKPKNNLKNDLKKNEIIEKVVEKINKFDNLQNYKMNAELCELICNLIENLVKKKYKFDKKNLFIDIYYKIFPSLTEDEKQSILKTIQYIYDNNLIKSVPISSIVFSCIGDWIKKKVL